MNDLEKLDAMLDISKKIDLGQFIQALAEVANAYPSLATEIRLLRGRVEMEHKSATMLREIYDILGPAVRDQTAAEAVRLLRKHAEAMAEALDPYINCGNDLDAPIGAWGFKRFDAKEALAAYRADYPKPEKRPIAAADRRSFLAAGEKP